MLWRNLHEACLLPCRTFCLTDGTAETSEQGDSGRRTRGDQCGPQQPRKTLFRRGVGEGQGDGVGTGHADGPLDPRLHNVSSADPSGCTSERQDLLEKGILQL